MSGVAACPAATDEIYDEMYAGMIKPPTAPSVTDVYHVPPRHRPMNPYLSSAVNWDADPTEPPAGQRVSQPDIPDFFQCPSDSRSLRTDGRRTEPDPPATTTFGPAGGSGARATPSTGTGPTTTPRLRLAATGSTPSSTTSSVPSPAKRASAAYSSNILPTASPRDSSCSTKTSSTSPSKPPNPPATPAPPGPATQKTSAAGTARWTTTPPPSSMAPAATNASTPATSLATTGPSGPTNPGAAPGRNTTESCRSRCPLGNLTESAMH